MKKIVDSYEMCEIYKKLIDELQDENNKMIEFMFSKLGYDWNEDTEHLE